MIIMALFVLTLGVVSVASLVTGKFTPWSSQPVYFRQRPVVFFCVRCRLFDRYGLPDGRAVGVVLVAC